MADELTFHASRGKAALVLLGSIIFVVIGYFMRVKEPLIGWACMIFSPHSTYLRLDREGFEMGSFVEKTRIKWTDVAGFELASIRSAKMIAIVYAPHYEGQKIGRAVARISPAWKARSATATTRRSPKFSRRSTNGECAAALAGEL